MSIRICYGGPVTSSFGKENKGERTNGYMKKKDNPVPDNNTWRYFSVIILVSFFGFFLFTLGSFFSDSLRRYIKDYFTDFITGDLLIMDNWGKLPDSFITLSPDTAGEDVPVINDYPALAEYLSGQKDILSFTPFSLESVAWVNWNQKRINMWLKTIDPQSFPGVFPRISFHTPDQAGSLPLSVLFLPRSLTQKIEDLLDTPLAEGEYLFISDHSTRILGIRETVFSGFVSYGGDDTAFPRTAFTSASSYPLEKINEQADENSQMAVTRLPGEDSFFRDILIREPPVETTVLPDSFFFQFFDYQGKTFTMKNPLWQYIAVSVESERKRKQIKNNLIHFCEMNTYPVSVLSWDEVAARFLRPAMAGRIGMYTMTCILFILLLFLSRRMISRTGELPPPRNEKHTPASQTGFIKKTTIMLYLSVCLSAAAGIIISVALVPLINAFLFTPGGKGILSIFPGENQLSLSVTFHPFLANLMVLVFLITLISIYPLVLLTGKSGRNKKADNNLPPPSQGGTATRGDAS
jgi:hypothetical protein